MNLSQNSNIYNVRPSHAEEIHESVSILQQADTLSTSMKLPFSLLQVWSGNVRQTGSSDNIAELAASIFAHGLLNPLLIKRNGRDGFMVIAGRRRYFAIAKLIEEGVMSVDSEIACTLLSDESQAGEISLVENAMQLPMHPADRFEAFRLLADNGMSVADIAGRFGISEISVHKLLKLGRVSPEVMNAYREQKIDYGQVQAFTLSDDAAEQNRILESILKQSWRGQPHQIRYGLVKDELPATDKRVKFIELEFYEMCGGTVRRDLFDDKNSGYIQDIALLDTLVSDKMQSAISEYYADGWKWVESVDSLDWHVMQKFRQQKPAEREFTADEKQEYDGLVDKYNARIDQIRGQRQEIEKVSSNAGEEEQEESDDYTDDFESEEEDALEDSELLALQERIGEMEKSLTSWTPDIKATSGVLMALQSDGIIKVIKGIIPIEEVESSSESKLSLHSPTTPQREKPEFSTTLYHDLTQHRTAAMRIELANNAEVALTAVVHSLIMNVFNPYSNTGCVKIKADQRNLFYGAENKIPSITALELLKEKYDVPEKCDDLWDWCMERSQEELLVLLAICTAHCVEAVYMKPENNSNTRHADQLATALGLDMRKWFSATGENCFSRISRSQILQAYRETTDEEPSPELQNLKKKDLAIRAEREIGDKWLPSVLR